MTDEKKESRGSDAEAKKIHAAIEKSHGEDVSPGVADHRGAHKPDTKAAEKVAHKAHSEADAKKGGKDDGQNFKNDDKKTDQNGSGDADESGHKPFSYGGRDREAYDEMQAHKRDVDADNQERHLNRGHRAGGMRVGFGETPDNPDGVDGGSSFDMDQDELVDARKEVERRDTGYQSPDDSVVERGDQFVGVPEDHSNDGHNRVHADELGIGSSYEDDEDGEDDDHRHGHRRTARQVELDRDAGYDDTQIDLDRDIHTLPTPKGHVAAPESETLFPLTDQQSAENYRFIRGQKAPPFAMNAADVKEPPYPRIQDPTHKAELHEKRERQATHKTPPHQAPVADQKRRVRNDIDESEK